MLLVEALKQQHWAEPKDIALSEDAGMGAIGGAFSGVTNVVFADGHPETLSNDVGNEMFRPMALMNDGQAFEMTATPQANQQIQPIQPAPESRK